MHMPSWKGALAQAASPSNLFVCLDRGYVSLANAVWHASCTHTKQVSTSWATQATKAFFSYQVSHAALSCCLWCLQAGGVRH